MQLFTYLLRCWCEQFEYRYRVEIFSNVAARNTCLFKPAELEIGSLRSPAAEQRGRGGMSNLIMHISATKGEP